MEIQCLEKSGDGLGTRSRNHGKRLRDGRFYGIPRIEGKEKAQKKEKVNASVDKSSGKGPDIRSPSRGSGVNTLKRIIPCDIVL